MMWFIQSPSPPLPPVDQPADLAPAVIARLEFVRWSRYEGRSDFSEYYADKWEGTSADPATWPSR